MADLEWTFWLTCPQCWQQALNPASLTLLPGWGAWCVDCGCGRERRSLVTLLFHCGSEGTYSLGGSLSDGKSAVCACSLLARRALLADTHRASVQSLE